MDLADGNETVLDCLATIRKKLPKSVIIVPPTVIQELATIYHEGETKLAQELAYKALIGIRGKWGFQPINCVPVGHGIVEETARKIRAKGLVPEEEVHDSFVIAESALANATLLISNDSHIKDIDQQLLGEVLERCDVAKLIVCSPRKIVSHFFGSSRR